MNGLVSIERLDGGALWRLTMGGSKGKGLDADADGVGRELRRHVIQRGRRLR